MGELSSLRLLRCAADFFCPWDVTWSWLLNQEHPMPYPERSKKTWAAHIDCRLQNSEVDRGELGLLQFNDDDRTELL